QLRAGGSDATVLPQFTAELVRCGGRVRAHRFGLVEALRPLAADALRELSDGGEELGLRYATDSDDAGGGQRPAPDETGAADVDTLRDPAAAAAALAATLRRRAVEEAARGISVAGPHRDDLEI